MSTQARFGRRATDVELMCLLDGELDDARREEILAELAENAELSGKLGNLELVGETLRTQVAEDKRADGLADAVMAKLEAEPAEEHAAPVIEGRFGPHRRVKAGARLRAANDNARSVFWMAGLAAAAAVGLFLWSRATLNNTDMSAARPRATGLETAVALQASTPPPEPKWLTAPTATAEPEASEESSAASVQVASVDFGSRSGSVFYVSTGSGQASTTTALVWVTDSVAGGK